MQSKLQCRELTPSNGDPRATRKPHHGPRIVLVILVFSATVLCNIVLGSRNYVEYSQRQIFGKNFGDKPSSGNVVGPNYPEAALDNPNPLHTFTVPRQRACTSRFNHGGSLRAQKLEIILSTPAPLLRNELVDVDESVWHRQIIVRNNLLQSLHRARYHPDHIVQLPSSDHILSDEASRSVRRLQKGSVVVLMTADTAALFTLPPEALVERFTDSGRRLLVAGSRTCDFCYCHSESRLPLLLLNMSIVETLQSDFGPNSAIVSPFTDGSFVIGYKADVLDFISRARSLSSSLCIEEKLVSSFLSMQSAGVPVGIDYRSSVFGTIQGSDAAVAEQWRVAQDHRALSVLGYKHIPTNIVNRESNPRFPYPPVLIFNNILCGANDYSCSDSMVSLYNKVCRVAITDAVAPYLLTPLRDPLMGIASGKRRRFGGFTRPRIVASLTTIPGRFEGVVETLRSMLEQDMPLDAVYLHVPVLHRLRFNTTFVESPESVTSLSKQFSHLIINRNCTDYGPATKLIPTLELERDPSTLIITVDDDMVFKPNAVRRLVRAHLNSPDTAFTNAGQIIDMATDGPVSTLGLSVRSADLWKDGIYPVDILEAFMGAIYRRDFFNVEVMKQISPECIYTDDIWVSANLAIKGIPRVKLLLDKDSRPTFSRNDQVAALRKYNVPLACGSDCSVKSLSDAKPATKDETIVPNRNDICAARLLLSHFYRQQRIDIGTKKTNSTTPVLEFKLNQVSALGSSGHQTIAAPLVRSEILGNVCPFEFTEITPYAGQKACSLGEDADDKKAWLMRAIAKSNQQPGSVAQLRRMRHTAIQVFRSPCITDLLSAAIMDTTRNGMVARILDPILPSEKRTSGNVLSSQLLCDSEFFAGNHVLHSSSMQYFVKINRVTERVNICIYKKSVQYGNTFGAGATAVYDQYFAAVAHPPERCLSIVHPSSQYERRNEILTKSYNYLTVINWNLCLFSTSRTPKTTSCDALDPFSTSPCSRGFIFHSDAAVTEMGCIEVPSGSKPIHELEQQGDISDLSRARQCVRVNDSNGMLEFISVKFNYTESRRDQLLVADAAQPIYFV